MTSLSHIKSCSNKSKGNLKNTCNNMALAWFIWILVSIHELWGSCSKDISSCLGAQNGAICPLGTEKLIHFCTIHSSCWDPHGPHHHRASLGCFAKGETRLWMLTISWLASGSLGSKPQFSDSSLNSLFQLKAVAIHSPEAFWQEASVSSQTLVKDGLWPPIWLYPLMLSSEKLALHSWNNRLGAC